MVQSLNARVIVDGVDITDRTSGVKGRQGRSPGVISRAFPSVCELTIADDDGYIGVLDRSADVVADALLGKSATVEVRISGGVWRVLFNGYVDDVEREEKQNRVTAKMRLLDDASRLANIPITLPDTTPEELTGARIRRVLTLAGVLDHTDIDDGTVNCLALEEEDTRTALEWCNDCAATEGGIFWPHAGKVSFLERQSKREQIARIGDGQSGWIWANGPPKTKSQQSLRVGFVRWTSDDGTRGSVGDESSGLRSISVNTLSSVFDTEELAEWWYSAFGAPYSSPSEIKLVSHAQLTSDLADDVLKIGLGETVQLHWMPHGSQGSISSIFIVDHITWALSPLDGLGSVVYLATLRFVPPVSILRWELGVAHLGVDSVLAPPGSGLTGHPRNRVPAGKSFWTDNDFVTSTSFTAWIAAQAIPVYDTTEGRDAAELDCDAGQLLYLKDLQGGVMTCYQDGWVPL